MCLFLVSAPPDQTVTANKDKEQHGDSSQKDLAVIAGLLFSLRVLLLYCAGLLFFFFLLIS